MNRRVWGALCALAVSLLPQLVRAQEDYGFQAKAFTCPVEYTIPYRQLVLNPTKSEKPGKLLLFLHGAGERGADNVRQLIHSPRQILAYCKKHQLKIVLLYPQCPAGRQWVDTPWGGHSHTMKPQATVYLQAALKLTESKIKEFGVDSRQVYVAGISMGGYGTWEAISRRPDLFAAALPICGGADLAQAPKLKELPIKVFHGDQDGVVPTHRSRDMVKALKDAGSKKVVYTEVPKCGHGVWNPAFDDEKTWEWLFKQVKK